MLFINNSGFIKSEGNYYITRTTGHFLVEIKNKLDKNITLFQFVEKGNIENGINDFKLDEYFSIKSIPFYKNSKKVLAYIIALWKTFIIVKKNHDFVYIFYPGHLPLLVSYICILLHKPYGIYVRGEYNKILSKPIFKHAQFINTIGSIFLDEIKKYNKQTNIIRPMVQYNFNLELNGKDVKKKNEILFVGRIEKRKGVWEIVEAAKKLKKELPDFSIRLVGAGKDTESISNYIKTEKLDNVVLHGPEFDSEKLSQLYLQSKIFLFPSHDEGFPRVLYEAMYFETPIITTFVGNIPSIMKDNFNCLKISVGASNSIVKQIKSLCLNSVLANELTKNGKKTLSLIFNDKIIDHSELLANQIIGYDKQNME